MREIVNVTNNLRDCDLTVAEITGGRLAGRFELADTREQGSFGTIGYFDTREEAADFAANKGGRVQP